MILSNLYDISKFDLGHDIKLECFAKKVSFLMKILSLNFKFEQFEITNFQFNFRALIVKKSDNAEPSFMNN